MKELEACPAGHKVDFNNGLKTVLSGFYIECSCGWKGPISNSPIEAKEAWNTMAIGDLYDQLRPMFQEAQRMAQDYIVKRMLDIKHGK